jgi:hypothetical protein
VPFTSSTSDGPHATAETPAKVIVDAKAYEKDNFIRAAV